MTNNNKKITWKAIVAVVLVMASLFAMSSLVNAGIVELILGEEYAAVAASASDSSSGGSGSDLTQCVADYNICKCGVKLSVTWRCIPDCTQRHEDKSELGTCQCYK